jgi:SAM-dependent methyltransferase
VKDLLYRLMGRASLVLDPLRGGSTAGDRSPDTDRTGLLVQDGRRVPILWNDADVLWAGYDSLAHSLWRAQELSLFKRHQRALVRPLLDFGTGDGSFAATLFDTVDYGVDANPEALAAARATGVYGTLIESTTRRIPMEAKSVRTVFSNSVLEHVVDLEATLSELRRLLRDDGALVFTAPVRHFTTHLAKYFGKAASERVNAESSHRNLLSSDEWVTLLDRHQFDVSVLHTYQPDWFTFWYRMCRLVGPRGLGRIFPNVRSWLWQIRRTSLVEMVRTSIAGDAEGANVFVIAHTRRG